MKVIGSTLEDLRAMGWYADDLIFFRYGDSKTAQSLYKSTLYYILLISLAMVADRKVLSKFDKDKIKLWLNQRVWAV